MSYTLRGQVYTFQVPNSPRARKYTMICPSFGKIVPYLKARPFDPTKLIGQQRNQNEKHVGEIVSEYENGNFTPTAWSASLQESHKQAMKISEKDGKEFVELVIDEDNPLDLNDGGHRNKGLKILHDQYKNNPTALRALESNPVPILVLLDGDPAIDFINLQKGMPVNPSHIKTLGLKTGQMDQNLQTHMLFARDVAMLLDENPKSHLFHQVNLDGSKPKRPITFNSITASTGAELGTSLIGGSKICSKFGTDNAEFAADQYALVFSKAYEAFKDKGFFSRGMVLCPSLYSGTKGASGLWLGIGNAWMYRILKTEEGQPTENDVAVFLDAVEQNLYQELAQSFSSKDKKNYLSQFTRALFADMDIPKSHEGIPVELCALTSPSTWGASSLVQRGRKPKAASVPDDIQVSEGLEEGNNGEITDDVSLSDATDDFFDKEKPKTEPKEAKPPKKPKAANKASGPPPVKMVEM